MRRIVTFAGIVCGLMIACLTCYSTRNLRVVRLRVSPPGLPDRLRGLRVAHLSDFHAGARGTPLALLREARDAALEFQPDLVALTGDFYDNGSQVAVAGLWSGWPDGTSVVAVLGNHDFRGGPDAPIPLVCELERGGVRVLRNTAERFVVRGAPEWIVGVDDPFTWRADEAAAFGVLPDDEDALLFLTHSPSIDASTPLGRARLALSGHTHGGQVRLLPSGRIPFVRAIRALFGAPSRRDPPVFRGYHWLRGMVVLISEGIGVSRLPVRFGTRPQVLLIELAAVEATGAGCDDVSRYVKVVR